VALHGVTTRARTGQETTHGAPHWTATPRARIERWLRHQQRQQEVKKADQATVQKQGAEKLNAQLESEVKANQVEIQNLQDELKVTVANQILFPEGGWEIHRTGEETLDKMVPALKSLQGQRVEVQGYTDDVPIGPELKARFPSNWELSTARATDVVRHLTSKGVDPSILSATGFGDTHPVASNATPEGKAKNRRIEIVIWPAGGVAVVGKR
jgi:chemotaxis protein MotB